LAGPKEKEGSGLMGLREQRGSASWASGPNPKNEKRINVFLFLFMNKFVNSFSRDFELIFEFCKNHSTHK
jgi:hypothetical protein